MMSLSMPPVFNMLAGMNIVCSSSTPTPSRSLNVVFQPSAVNVTFVSYIIQISCTATLLGGQTGTVQLLSDQNSTPSTVRALVSNANSVSLALAITAVNDQKVQLCGFIQPGHNALLSSSGTATIAIISQTETALWIA